MCKNADSDELAIIMRLIDDELEPSSEIVGVEVDWLLSDGMENQPYDTANQMIFRI